MEIEVGKIKESEKEEAHQFCKSIFEELGWDMRFAYGLDDLYHFFAKSGDIFLLAKKEGGIIACAGLKRLSEKEGLLKRFYVASDFRGKGVSNLMLEKIKAFAKEQGYEAILLDVQHNNLRAKRFYDKQGFLVFKPGPYHHWPESEHPEIFQFRRLDLEKG